MMELILESAIICPYCGHMEAERMPIDACLYVYDCPHCGIRLTPRLGDCCVFCSYGSVPCPPRQRESTCRDC